MDKKKVVKFIGNIFFYSVLASLILVCAVMLKARKDGTQPELFGNKFFIVLTGSMEPTIKVGDLVIVNTVESENVKANDIITFGSSGSDNITTHRVNKVLESNGEISFVTKGDANNVEDPTAVADELVIGRVTKVVPKVGTWMLWIQNNMKQILVGIIVVIFGSSIFLVLKDKYLKEKSKSTLNE